MSATPAPPISAEPTTTRSAATRPTLPPAPTLLPGLVPLWRSAGETQVGADPRLALVLGGLSAREQRFVDSLTWPRLREVPLRQAARQHRIHLTRATAIVEHLRRRGCLANPREPSQRLATQWRAGTARSRATAEVCVVVDHHCAGLGLTILRHLAAEGVGRLGLVADGTVTAADAEAGFAVRDVGRSRVDAVIAPLRAVAPLVKIGVATPDVVVVVESRVAVPYRSSGLVREDMTHLSVVSRELDVVVGPLVGPGGDPGLRGLDLTRTDRDHAWPALATQLAAAAPPPTGPALRALAAATAALEVVDVVDGRDPSLVARTMELGARSVPVTREWAPHPACGCGAHERAPLGTPLGTPPDKPLEASGASI